MASPKEKLPPRGLPVVYLVVAHLSLLLAFFLVAARPEAVRGFFYHPRLLGVVHLVTLGWITSTTLGATYVVGPLALRAPARARPRDWVACGLFLAGLTGVVGHFWFVPDGPASYWGLAGAGALLLAGLAIVAVRTWIVVARGAAPLPVRLHVVFAYGNLLLAAVVGILLAINKATTILPQSQLSSVFAHVHLAAVGWVTMMVAGVGYRLLAMMFPAAPPPDKPVWASLALFEAGVLVVAGSLLFHPPGARVGAVLLAGAVATFLGTIAWMRFHPRPAPKKLKRPDVGVWIVFLALVYLLVATVAGLIVVFSEGWDLDAIWIYGIAGLLGFLSQVIVGVEMRLLPMFSWTQAWALSEYRTLPTPPHEMPRRLLQFAVLGLWTVGLPVLGGGFVEDAEWAIVWGARCLFLAVACAAANNALVVRHAFFLRGARAVE